MRQKQRIVTLTEHVTRVDTEFSQALPAIEKYVKTKKAEKERIKRQEEAKVAEKVEEDVKPPLISKNDPI